MSNYLFAAGNCDVIESLSHILDASKNHEEVRTYVLNSNKSILCVSNSENDNGPDFFFKGWFSDPKTESVVVGAKGLITWEREHGKRLDQSSHLLQGSYFHASWMDDVCSVSNDLFSMFPIMYFSNKDIAVFSDSLYILSKIRLLLGIKNSHNKAVLHSRAWGHGLGCSLATFETQVQGISYLPPGGTIQISLGDSVSISVDILDVKHVFSEKQTNYPYILHEYLNNLFCTLTSFESSGFEIELALSGGLDSRILLSLLLAVENSHSTKIVTNNHFSRKLDYDIVESLSKKFKFEFNQTHQKDAKEIRSQQTLDDKFKLWTLSCLGFFDMMYFKGDYPKNAQMVRLGGHGAEIAKRTFHERNVESLVRTRKITRKAILSRSIWSKSLEIHKHNKIMRNIRRTLSDALEYVHIDPSSKDAIMWHHVCYKSPIANSRYLSNSMLGYRPLIDHNLLSCTLGLEEADGINMFKDLLIMANPTLALHPFENAKYDMEQGYVSSRMEFLGVQFKPTQLKPFKMYIQHEKIKNGPPLVFLDLVESIKKSYPTPVAMIRDLLNETWAVLGDDLKDIYQNTYDSTMAKLGEKKPYFPSAAVGAAKIFSLGLVEKEISKFGI
jgi:hypothetical protein